MSSSAPDSQADGQSLTGILVAVRFHQNNFLIGQVEQAETGRLVAVKGNMAAPQTSLQYTFHGKSETHPKFGPQFAFTHYEAQYPTSTDAIRQYLIENAKWIGPRVSRAIVDKYGSDSLTVCKNEPERVAAEVAGITLDRATEIASMLLANERHERLHMALQEIIGGTAVTKWSTSKILELWGEDAPGIIRANPYLMADMIDGVGFLTADEVARKIGFAHDGPERLRAGLLHTLRTAARQEGHVCMTELGLVSKAAELLAVGSELVRARAVALIAEADIKLDGGMLYTEELHADEGIVANKLRVLMQATKPKVEPIAIAAPGATIDSLGEAFVGMMDDQRAALVAATQSPVMILTGAPGTGKTWTIKRILDLFPDAHVKLAAPTGKAARRVIDQTGMDATTIHRLLEPMVTGGKFQFTRNHANPIKADLIVLDEVSMVDVSLMARFLSAVGPGTRLILVGDTYQLPSVGPGSVLRDLIASGVIPSVELTIIKRQDEGLIVRNCHAIKAGRSIQIDNESRDFFFLDAEDPVEVQAMIFDLVARRLPAHYQADPLRDIQILSPTNEKSDLSCKALNKLFQEKWNTRDQLKGSRFKVGDKVIQTKNDYENEIVNGDIGYVTEIDNTRDKTITVQFENPDRAVALPLHSNELQLAYAITCHKFQGSESRIVVIPVHSCFGGMILQRNWIYTAISRAREVCVLVGQEIEAQKAVRRNRSIQRLSRLRDRLAAVGDSDGDLAAVVGR